MFYNYFCVCYNMAMKHIQVTIKTTQEFEEMASFLLMENGAEGASITDKQDYLNLIRDKEIWDYVDENLPQKYDKYVYIKTCFKMDQKDNIKQFKKQVKESLTYFPESFCKIHTKVVQDKNWNTEWRKFYKPLTFENVVINPKWIEANYGDKVVINIDPSMAFGTGQHESTSNCLNLIQQIETKNMEVLDLGCGSGILGITALKLGAKNCLFVEIDAMAMNVCKDNCLLNNLANCEFLVSDNINSVNKQFDIVLANLTVDLLTMYSTSIKRVLKTNGCLIMSGIIDGRQAEIEQVFKNLDINIISHTQKGDWHSYIAKN